MFGRGTFGGGGYNCRAALKAIKEYGVSTGLRTIIESTSSLMRVPIAALFAPGWVFEEHGAAHFEENQVLRSPSFLKPSLNLMTVEILGPVCRVFFTKSTCGTAFCDQLFSGLWKEHLCRRHGKSIEEHDW